MSIKVRVVLGGKSRVYDYDGEFEELLRTVSRIVDDPKALLELIKEIYGRFCIEVVE